MDVGVQSWASSAMKANAVPMFARGVELRNGVASALPPRFRTVCLGPRRSTPPGSEPGEFGP
jgi:hypothetical protein